jgi:pimeloyl-ACP methyl ester carboxylesterase
MAMVLATRHPEWVERIIAVNGGPLAGTDDSVRMLPATREEARATMARLRDASSPAIPDHVLDDLVRRSRSGPFTRFVATSPATGEWVLTEAQLGTIRIPVRLIWGLSDGFMPLAYAERMRAALADVELITLERCGHVPQQEAPERFLAALRQALDEASPVEAKSTTGA